MVLKAHDPPRPASSLVDRLTILKYPIRLHRHLLDNHRPSHCKGTLHRQLRSWLLLLMTVIAQFATYSTIISTHPQSAMAPTLFDSSNSVFQQLEQTRQDFWSSNAHLSEEQRQELWLQAASIPSNAFGTSHASLAHQTPRSMPSSSNMTHLPVWTHIWFTLALSNTH